MSRLAGSVLVFLVLTSSYADPTGLYVRSGGTLCVLDNHPTVALRHETIRFLVGYSGARVEVDLAFENTGPAQDVLIGFPVFAGAGAVWDLTCKADDDSIPMREAEKIEGAPTVKYGSYTLGALWWVGTVPFAASQTRELHIAYNQLHGYGRPSLRYFLATGANWQGDVDWVDVEVRYTEPDNWTAYAGPQGTGKWRYEHYKGDPVDFIVMGHPNPEFTCGGFRYYFDGASRRLAVVEGKPVVDAVWFADAIGARLSQEPDGRLRFTTPRPMDAAAVRNADSLISKLRGREDPVASLMSRCIPRDKWRQITEPVAGGPTEAQRLDLLLAELSRITTHAYLATHAELLSAHIKELPLRDETLALLHHGAGPGQGPQGWDRVRLNRMILADVYRSELAPPVLEPAGEGAVVAALPCPRFAEAFDPAGAPARDPGEPGAAAVPGTDWADLGELCRALGRTLDVGRDTRGGVKVSVGPA